MPRRPNLLIYMNDQEQAHVTAPDHPCRTPNADRLAAEGIRFTRCYTPTAHCCPSRATFQTGLYPSGHGVYNNICNDAAIHTSIYPGIPTFGEILGPAGYTMKWSGKWHVTCDRTPADCGWEELWAGATRKEHHGLRWEQYRERFAAGDDQPHDRPRGCVLRPGWGTYRLYGTLPQGDRPHPYSPGDYQIVTTGLRGLAEAVKSAEPWCLFIGPNGPHDPYIIPEHYATMYPEAHVEMPASWRDNMSDKPGVYQRQRHLWSQLTDAEQREAVGHYWGYCTMQDDLLGMVLDALEESGQAEDTVVLFLSDHGDYNGAHGLWMKGVPAFDEAYHVPCIVRWPAGIVNPGREVDDFVTLADFAPTFIELAGCAPIEPHHGRSLAPFFADDRPDDWPETFFSQFNGVELYYSQRVVQTREWKYVYNGFDWDELYHLTADPHERVNLARQPEYREVIRELCGRMWRFGEETRDINCNPYPTVSLAPFGPMTGLAANH